ncbi:acyl-CoA:lysophosphatidylglycerol acyltransferase 1 isoform X1 [Macaca thibetana thibetana]|uniref:acyl-CoA:lysophosphatidylglycerol acyltransferase 1 isoform X1 n=1 Tax=Macaca mulatta TaxID=9544 RepID=UPI0007329E16|nr:acyl-CoA:lysophosphatidylglycerol acyltransferase 1 isoform X1 [Macaca mulatta]XP_014972824.1 acyl-CoA:lysophosphatidylglycerol acyltransferase 1 isoform X1 [Macaca mulatta]XP_050636915.1 acyl-CoA:lysophosphatidylglycerol acyltransferase 1 isoform X1 [Macaca thibetana thibetana]
MAMTLEEAPWLGWLLVKALMRFAFMVANNLVAIPSYICYVIILQPLRVLDSKRFWYIEGIMYKWLLGMVASWGWYAGYTVLQSNLLIQSPILMQTFECLLCVRYCAGGWEYSGKQNNIVPVLKKFTVMEWGEDIKAVSKDEAVMLVNHQATGDVCTLMMCLQDKGLVVAQMMWLMDHIFKYTNFGIVSLVHGDFFIRQGRSYRDQQLLLLKKHLENNYRSRDRKWIVLFPEGGFLRKRRETSQAFAKKNNLPFLTNVTLPRSGATKIILNALVAQQKNGSPAGGDAKELDSKSKGLQWIIDTTIAYPKAEPIDIQTWILGYRKPTVTHVHYRPFSLTVFPCERPQPLATTLQRIFPIKDVPLETDDLTTWLYQRFVEKEDLLSHFYETGAFPPSKGHKEAVSREMTLSNMWIFLIQSFAFLSGYMWYNIIQYFYHCLF